MVRGDAFMLSYWDDLNIGYVGVFKLADRCKMKEARRERGHARSSPGRARRPLVRRVVGCTCLGVKHPLFSRRRFDYCVVDEAGQISQPVVLAPLRCADVFVLVGDQYQLPPLVTSKVG